MLITNWQRVLSDKKHINSPGVYQIYDNHGRCLYIGSSKNVRHRLVYHVRPRTLQNASHIGRFIARWIELSKDWPIVIIEPKDFVHAWRSIVSELKGDTIPFTPKDLSSPALCQMIESHLIYLNSPVFNVLMNNSVPKRTLSSVEREYYFKRSPITAFSA